MKTEVTIPTAKEAKAESLEVRQSAFDSEMNEIADAIAEGTADGKNHVCMYCNLSTVAIEHLSKLGYKIKSTDHRNETTTTITW